MWRALPEPVSIEPAAEGGRGVLKLRRQPNGRSRLIDAKRFFGHHGLTLDKARGLAVEDFGIMRKPRPESLR